MQATEAVRVSYMLYPGFKKKMVFDTLLTSQNKATDIEQWVSSYYGISTTKIKGNDRHRVVVLARHVAMYLIRKHTKMGLVAIGRRFSSRDHTSVIHACKAINNLIETEDSFRKQISHLEYKILQ